MKKLEGAGLRGQSAGQTSLSTVEQEGSLRYLGYSIEDLAENASFEEVAYLLLLGKLPSLIRKIISGLNEVIGNLGVLNYARH